VGLAAAGVAIGAGIFLAVRCGPLGPQLQVVWFLA
jgi:hypothetical protein